MAKSLVSCFLTHGVEVEVCFYIHHLICEKCHYRLRFTHLYDVFYLRCVLRQGLECHLCQAAGNTVWSHMVCELLLWSGWVAYQRRTAIPCLFTLLYFLLKSKSSAAGRRLM